MTPAELKATLARQGLTQADLARLLGVDRSRVTAWGKGKWKIHPALAAYLELREKRRPGYLDPGENVGEIKQGVGLLRFCAKRGLDWKQALRLIAGALRRRKNAGKIAARHQTRLTMLRRARAAPVLMARWRTSHTSNPEKRGSPGKPRPPKRCSICRELEHDARTCPSKRREGE